MVSREVREMAAARRNRSLDVPYLLQSAASQFFSRLFKGAYNLRFCQSAFFMSSAGFHAKSPKALQNINFIVLNQRYNKFQKRLLRAASRPLAASALPR
jgi:hypothetical protein